MAPALIPVATLSSLLAAELPAWRAEGGVIVRRFETTGWKATLMIVNAIGHLAEAAWHHPDLKIGYAKVTVMLQTHRVRGVTMSDVELAGKIDEVALWKPAEADALDGFPKKWVH